MKNDKSIEITAKKSLYIAVFCLALWLISALCLGLMLIQDGLDEVILTQPILFFGLLAVSVFLLATGINHLICAIRLDKPNRLH